MTISMQMTGKTVFTLNKCLSEYMLINMKQIPTYPVLEFAINTPPARRIDNKYSCHKGRKFLLPLVRSVKSQKYIQHAYPKAKCIPKVD